MPATFILYIPLHFNLIFTSSWGALNIYLHSFSCFILHVFNYTFSNRLEKINFFVNFLVILIVIMHARCLKSDTLFIGESYMIIFVLRLFTSDKTQLLLFLKDWSDYCLLSIIGRSNLLWTHWFIDSTGTSIHRFAVKLLICNLHTDERGQSTELCKI